MTHERLKSIRRTCSILQRYLNVINRDALANRRAKLVVTLCVRCCRKHYEALVDIITGIIYSKNNHAPNLSSVSVVSAVHPLMCSMLYPITCSMFLVPCQ